MIIAGAQLDITTRPIGVTADDQKRFAMRFQADHTVDDVRASFFETTSPLNIDRFIKPGA